MGALQAAHLTEDDGAERREARQAAQHVNDMGLLSCSVEFRGCSHWGGVWSRARAREELLHELAVQRQNQGPRAAAQQQQKAVLQGQRARAWWSKWAVGRWGVGEGDVPEEEEGWGPRCEEGVALTEWGLELGTMPPQLQRERFLAGAQEGVASGRWGKGSWRLALVADVMAAATGEPDRSGQPEEVEEVRAGVVAFAAMGAREADERRQWALEEEEAEREQQQRREQWRTQQLQAEDQRRQGQQDQQQQQQRQRQKQRAVQKQRTEEECEWRRRAGRARQARAAAAAAAVQSRGRPLDWMVHSKRRGAIPFGRSNSPVSRTRPHEALSSVPAAAAEAAAAAAAAKEAAEAVAEAVAAAAKVKAAVVAAVQAAMGAAAVAVHTREAQTAQERWQGQIQVVSAGRREVARQADAVARAKARVRGLELHLVQVAATPALEDLLGRVVGCLAPFKESWAAAVQRWEAVAARQQQEERTCAGLAAEAATSRRRAVAAQAEWADTEHRGVSVGRGRTCVREDGEARRGRVQSAQRRARSARVGCGAVGRRAGGGDAAVARRGRGGAASKRPGRGGATDDVDVEVDAVSTAGGGFWCPGRPEGCGGWQGFVSRTLALAGRFRGVPPE